MFTPTKVGARRLEVLATSFVENMFTHVHMTDFRLLLAWMQIHCMINLPLLYSPLCTIYAIHQSN